MSADKHRKKHTGKKARYPKMSRTAGILKGEACKKSQLKTEGAKNSRLYRTNPSLFQKYTRKIYEINNIPIPKDWE